MVVEDLPEVAVELDDDALVQLAGGDHGRLPRGRREWARAGAADRDGAMDRSRRADPLPGRAHRPSGRLTGSAWQRTGRTPRLTRRAVRPARCAGPLTRRPAP